MTPYLPAIRFLFVASATLVGTANDRIGNYSGLHVFQRRLLEIVGRSSSITPTTSSNTTADARSSSPVCPLVRISAQLLADGGTACYLRFLLFTILEVAALWC